MDKITKEKAKQILMEQGRFNFEVEFAKEICNAFDVEFNDSLIRTKRGYRENIDNPSYPRVNCCSLAEYICKKLGKQRDEEQYKHSCNLSGVGSYMDAESKAYAMNL